MSNFFLVSSGMSSAELRIVPQSLFGVKVAFRDYKHLNDPPLILRFEIAGGRRCSDFLVTSLLPITLVSDEFAEMARQNTLTGWDTYAVELSGRTPLVGKSYSGLRIRGRCGPIDNRASTRVITSNPHSTESAVGYRGLYLLEATWDGSDLFVPSDDSAFLFCTSRFKECFVRARLTGARFTPIAEVERLML